MGLAGGGDAGSAHFEQPVSASSVRGTRRVGRQNRSARDFSPIAIYPKTDQAHAQMRREKTKP
jgi:hypothetical protein